MAVHPRYMVVPELFDSGLLVVQILSMRTGNVTKHITYRITHSMKPYLRSATPAIRSRSTGTSAGLVSRSASLYYHFGNDCFSCFLWHLDYNARSEVFLSHSSKQRLISDHIAVMTLVFIRCWLFCCRTFSRWLY